MLVDFEDFDNVWSKFEDFGNQIYNNVGVPLYNASEQVSTVVRDNADKVYIVKVLYS